MIKAQTLKGFRDFLPSDAGKRRRVMTTFARVFERFGFDPLETPAIEYAETLLGKYGSEADKLLYIFKDNGGRSVGLRYDQTVPLSRVIAQYHHALPLPFKRYQIQPVWRAENTQKGRYREFLQCDIDTIGSDSPLADAEIIDCALTAACAFGLTAPMMTINDRAVFDQLSLTKQEVTIMDKIEKIGRDEVIGLLEQAGRAHANALFDALKEAKPTERLSQVFDALKRLGHKEEVDIRFDPFLARGLDYYTSTIFELNVAGYSGGSLAGGGRYDTLIGSFTGKNIPATGLAFGFDRFVEALEEANLLPATETATSVLITVFCQDLLKNALSQTSRLRDAGINTEVFLDWNAKLDKQLSYADRKGIPYVIIQGPEEQERNVVKLKEMRTKHQTDLTVDQVIERLRNDN